MLYRLQIEVSDLDRGVYATLDLRVAQHPSETSRFLVTRALAYALAHEEGIAFSAGGLSDPEEPALTVRDPRGGLVRWIEVGVPSVDRLARALRAAPEVLVFSHRPLAPLAEKLGAAALRHAERLTLVEIPEPFVDAVAARLDRTSALSVTRTEGRLYVGLAGDTLETGLITTRADAAR